MMMVGTLFSIREVTLHRTRLIIIYMSISVLKDRLPTILLCNQSTRSAQLDCLLCRYSEYQ